MPEKGEVITYQFTRRESGWNRLSKRRKRAILDAYNTVSRTFAPELSDSEHKANVKRWLGTTLFPSAMRSKRLREELGIPDDSGGGYKKFPELRSYIIALRNISRETVEPVHEVTHAFFGEKNLELNSFHKALASAMHWIYWTRDWKAVKFPKITKFDIDNKTILAPPKRFRKSRLKNRPSKSFARITSASASRRTACASAKNTACPQPTVTCTTSAAASPPYRRKRR